MNEWKKYRILLNWISEIPSNIERIFVFNFSLKFSFFFFWLKIIDYSLFWFKFFARQGKYSMKIAK